MAKKTEDNGGESGRQIQGFSRNARIYFGEYETEDGGLTKYGPKNNPRREGSKVGDQFSKFKDGMTIQKALDSGLTSGDIRRNLKKGFIRCEEAA